jgi:hypothetical protein
MARGAVLFTIVVLALACGRATGADAPPQVTVIGDSVSTAITKYDDLRAVVANGLRVDWQVAICRTTAGQSCPFQGTRPSTLVDLVPTLGAVAPVVVVELGYNDPDWAFPASIDSAMRTLLAHGAQHVLWLTLHSARGPYPELNDDLWAATARWPQLELVDWDAASANDPEWFQLDAIHLDKRGGRALAQLIRSAVTRYVAPLRIEEPALPARRVFAARMTAAGGTPPYTWRSVSTLPTGLHLRADGTLVARLRRLQPVHAAVEVEDSLGARAFATLSADR